MYALFLREHLDFRHIYIYIFIFLLRYLLWNMYESVQRSKKGCVTKTWTSQRAKGYWFISWTLPSVFSSCSNSRLLGKGCKLWDLHRVVATDHTTNSKVRVFLDTLIGAQLVKKFNTFIKSEGSLSCFQKPTIESYPDLTQSISHPHHLT
jgi:hypothetical protein